MEELKGYVERIIYTNPDNGHTIMEVSLSSEEVKRLRDSNDGYEDEIYDLMTCVGILNLINPGTYVVFRGDFVVHPNYGVQFKAVSYEESEPEDLDSIERYLGSGAIKGIGAALAGRIVKKFKNDTFRIIEEEPERLAEVKGISSRMAMEIADQVVEKKEMRRAMLYLQELGIGMNLAVKIYKKYGDALYQTMETNPYRLADDIEGVGFKIADEIAGKMGMAKDSPDRIKSGILYTLQQAVAGGHVFLPKDMLLERSGNILGTEIEEGEELLMDMIIAGKIMVKPIDGESVVYPRALYNTESMVANKLVRLNNRYEIDEEYFEHRLSVIEHKEELELDKLQRRAVKEAVTNGLLVITGGPGTGKTTTINTIIKYFEDCGMEILLAAPTGRAAKRMTEATGYEAQTIHRLLELSGLISEESGNAAFGRNEDNPLEADVIIIDEMSMVDIFLMSSLLRAVAEGTRLILVGDANQLPSVGPGAVLRDIIMSKEFAVVELTRIFRQEEVGDIVNNAHKINAGERVEIGAGSKDFPFIKRGDSNSIINAMITLVSQKLPAYTNCKVDEVQVLTPTRKGNLGVEHLNVVLQQYLNPKSDRKVEKEIGGVIYREGDKVMQIKNNYNLSWEVRGYNGIPVDTGLGVFNGDMGIIDNINLFLNELTVRFEENKYVCYSFKEVDELEHAYAVTVHKSQGSEYPAVVFPLFDGPRMLMNRNILYTAVTRARKCICVVGDENSFYDMIANESEQRRYTSLAMRIREAATLA